MKDQPITVCYYPTTTVFIDDNQSFLKPIRLSFADYPCKFYDDSAQALLFLTHHYSADPFIKRCITSTSEVPLDHVVQDIDIRKIHTQVYFPIRFDEVSVLVIDYAMPNLNGLELSRQIKQIHPLINIILLTGEAQHDLATEAFNEGVINKFILKSTMGLVETLRQAIHELQIKYFAALSAVCFNDATQAKYPINCLHDPIFIGFFAKLCDKYRIVEYYLVDNQGSFLLIDKDGKPSCLAVQSASELENFYQHAELEQAPDAIVNALKTKQQVLYFFSEEDLKAPPAVWAKYLHPATALQGKETYYYSYISNPQSYDIQTQKIISYQRYIDSIQ